MHVYLKIFLVLQLILFDYLLTFIFQLMHEFSLPSTMLHKLNPLTHSQEQAIFVQMVAWMLRHRLLMQLHTYVYFMPTKKGILQIDVSTIVFLVKI